VIAAYAPAMNMAAWAAAGTVGQRGFSWTDAAAVFVIGVVIIIGAATLLGRHGGRRWGVAWGLRSRWRRGGVRAAAAADVASMQEEDEMFFQPDGPGHQEDEL
jgi:cytosine/uracil/thiamine/allantoin permease